MQISLVDNDLVVLPEGFTAPYESIQSFLDIEWAKGTAYYPDGSSRPFDGMRFNLPEDRAEVNANGNILPLLPGVVTGFSMHGTRERVFVNVPLQQNVFMELLSAGNADLLVYRRVDDEELPDIEGSVNTFRFEKEQKIIEFKEYVYVWSGGEVAMLKPTKKFVLSMMKDHADEVDAYIKREKIKLKSPDMLVKLFNYYNSL